MYQLNRNVVTAATLLAAITLTACGGGSSHSGGGGPGGTKSSSVVIEMSSGMAMLPGPAEEMDGMTRVAAAISDLLMRNAWAQLAGVPIFFNGIQVGATDATGTFVQAVSPGPLEVCIVSTVPSKCFDLGVIGEDQVVVVDGVDLVGDRIVHNDPRTESAFDNLALFESDKSHKVYICHKGRTLDVSKSSVGMGVSMKGHQTHGDYLGACDDVCNNPAAESTSPGDSGKDNKGNNNRCNKGNKDKKNCEVTNEQV